MTTAIVAGSVPRCASGVPHSGGQQVLIYHAEPGSESAAALEKLSAVASE